MKPTKRKLPADRSADILAAAIRLSRKHGYTNVSRDAIAAEAGCTNGLVTHYLGTMVCVKRRIVGHAIATKDMIVLAQAIINKDARVKNLPDELRSAAIKSLL